MTSFRSRPRFQHHSKRSPEQIRTSFRDCLKDNPHHITGQVFPSHILLRIKEDHRHVWSPQLSIDFEQDYQGNIEVSGIYGPMPSIWTKIAFSYFLFGVLILFSAIIGGSQYVLGTHDWVLYLIPTSIIAIIITYLITQTGQKLGAEQTFILHHFYEKTMETKVQVS